MGFKLRREVRDWLPPGLLTLGERTVLLELADVANDDSRIAYPGMDELCRMTDLPASTVSKCLQRLGAKGLEVRVEIGRAADGRPVYAARGHQTTYRIPQVSKGGPTSGLSSADRADPGPGFEERKGGPVSGKGRTTIPERADVRPVKGGPGSAPSPQGTLIEPSVNTSETPPLASLASSSQTTPDDDARKQKNSKPDRSPNAAAILAAQTDARRDETKPFTAWLRQQYPQIRNVGLYLAGCIEDGSLQDRLEEARDHWEAIGYDVVDALERTGVHLNGSRDTFLQIADAAARSGHDAAQIIEHLAAWQTANPDRPAVDMWSAGLKSLAGKNKGRRG